MATFHQADTYRQLTNLGYAGVDLFDGLNELHIPIGGPILMERLDGDRISHMWIHNDGRTSPATGKDIIIARVGIAPVMRTGPIIKQLIDALYPVLFPLEQQDCALQELHYKRVEEHATNFWQLWCNGETGTRRTATPL